MGRRNTTTTTTDSSDGQSDEESKIKMIEKEVKELIDKGDKHLIDEKYDKAHSQYSDALKDFNKHKNIDTLKPLYRKAWTQKALALQGLRIVSPRYRTQTYLDALRDALRMANSLQE